MVKNDYRRAFIMLRPARQGFGGHVRLEKRALSGNLYFIVTAPESAGPLSVRERFERAVYMAHRHNIIAVWSEGRCVVGGKY